MGVRQRSGGAQAIVTEPALPSKTTMAKNAVTAATQAVTSGFTQTSGEEQTRRHNICKYDCKWYRVSDDRCGKCGCRVNYKKLLRSWKCPIGKW